MPAIARVPGKVMLAGEYAVLSGGRCLAASVDLWLEAKAAASEAPRSVIRSDLWPSPRFLERHGSEPTAKEPLLEAAALAQKLWWQDQSFEISIESKLDVKFGLGSSSAVRLAALMSLYLSSREGEYNKVYETTIDLARLARELQVSNQSFASGYDVLTQAVGGLVLWTPEYQAWPGSVQKFSCQGIDTWVHVYVGGKGAPTGALGGSVRHWLQEDQRESMLTHRSEALIDALLLVLQEGWSSAGQTLIAAVKNHRSFFEAAPGFPHNLNDVLKGLAGYDETWSFKTTGAGGEDAILIIGPTSELGPIDRCLRLHAWYPLPASFTDKGACYASKQEMSL